MNKEYIGKGVSVFTNENHTFGTDAVLLADFAGIQKNEKPCDFGTGCGIIPMIWARDEVCKNEIHAVEIQKEACEIFEKTIKENNFEDKIKISNSDINFIKEHFSHSSFDVVTMNPPYFEKNSGKESPNESVRIARHEIMSDIFSAAKSASYVLKYSGRFCVCHRAERLCDVYEAMRKNNIEPKRLRHVMNYPDSSPWLVLVEGRKGGKNKLVTLPPLVLYNKDKKPSEEYERIYSAFYEKESEK